MNNTANIVVTNSLLMFLCAHSAQDLYEKIKDFQRMPKNKTEVLALIDRALEQAAE